MNGFHEIVLVTVLNRLNPHTHFRSQFGLKPEKPQVERTKPYTQQHQSQTGGQIKHFRSVSDGWGGGPTVTLSHVRD